MGRRCKVSKGMSIDEFVKLIDEEALENPEICHSKKPAIAAIEHFTKALLDVSSNNSPKGKFSKVEKPSSGDLG